MQDQCNISNIREIWRRSLTVCLYQGEMIGGRVYLMIKSDVCVCVCVCV